jgi:hypothetical protein
MDKRNGETKEKKSNEFDRALIINDYIKHQVTSLDEKIKALKQQYKEIGDNLSKAKRDRNDLKTYKSQMLFILNRPSGFRHSVLESIRRKKSFSLIVVCIVTLLYFKNTIVNE